MHGGGCGQQSSEGVYSSGSQSEAASRGFQDMGEQGLKVLWRKGSWDLENHVWGHVAQSLGNQPLLGLLLVEHSSSCGCLDDTNLLAVWVYFLK